jgi:hypothetical protein
MGEGTGVTVQLDLDFSQVKKLLDWLPQKQKETLARYLTAAIKTVRKAQSIRARRH